MKINDILGYLLMLFSLYMAGNSVRTHNSRSVFIWLLVAALNGFSLYLSAKRQARAKKAQENDDADPPLEDPLVDAKDKEQIDAMIDELDEEDVSDDSYK